MAVPRHPDATKGSLSVHRSETAWRFRRKALKSVRREGKVEIRQKVDDYKTTRRD